MLENELEKFANPAGAVMDGDHMLDGGDRKFTALLHQLAQLHRSRLDELHTLRAQRGQKSLGRDGNFLQQDHPQQGLSSTSSSRDSCTKVSSDKHGSHAKELSVLPQPRREAAPEQDTCDDIEVLHLDESLALDPDKKCRAPPADKTSRAPSAAWSAEPFYPRKNWLRADSVGPQNVSTINLLSPIRSTDWIEGEFGWKREATMKLYEGYFRRFILFPASTKRLVWDLIGAVLIFWDLLIIPLNLSGLAPKDSVFIDFMDWLTLLFWTFNMAASLMVGYVKDGVTEMSPVKILTNYLKTWFVLDVIVVLPDWIFTCMSGNDDGASDSVKVLRMFRLVRCMRLLRLAKLRTIINSITDTINSEYTSIVVNIIKMMVALITTNHLIGCAWYLTAESQMPGNTWITVHGFRNEDWAYKYLTSFHWGITQFTPSSMHVQPQNPKERLFAITVVIFGLIGFSYLVGSITGSLQELRKMNSDTSKLFWMLRRYLRQNEIPRELSVRIQKYLMHKHTSLKVGVSAEHVSVLKHLSDQLEDELQCALNVPHMLVHPLFGHLNTLQPVTMQRLATKAMARKQLATRDSLFSSNETATDMSFVIAGSLQYMKTSPNEHQRVRKGIEWISEPVLWTEWRHLGELVAECPSDLLLINATAFGNIIKTYQQVHLFVSAYAANFLAWINGMERERLSDITQGDSCVENVWEPMGGRTTHIAGDFFSRSSARRSALSLSQRVSAISQPVSGQMGKS